MKNMQNGALNFLSESRSDNKKKIKINNKIWANAIIQKIFQIVVHNWFGFERYYQVFD